MNLSRNCGVDTSSRSWLLVLGVVILVVVCCPVSSLAQKSKSLQFSITFPATRSAQPLDGRLLLLLSNDPSAEPRMQINDTPRTQMLFGTDVEGLKPGETATIDERAF